MNILNFFTGAAGYSAIAAAVVLALIAHFAAPKTWSALAWAVVLGLLAAAFVGQREVTAAAQLRASYAEVREQILIADVAKARADGLAAVNVMSALRRADAAERDTRFFKELTDARSENNRLRAAARAGTAVVRVQGARCAAGAGAVPDNASAVSVGDAAVEADAELREAVLDHREALVTATQQIEYLQDYARSCAEMGQGKGREIARKLMEKVGG